jgi:CRISPR-associated protein Cmr6
MPNIPDAYQKVPMMFRAQVDGRCQLQRIRTDKVEPDVIRWVSEWVEKAASDFPDFGREVQTRTYSLNWRFVTNGGQDDGIIRPVIGARGLPYYPGSSMKGVFARACNPSQRQRYCGGEEEDGECTPGILRFHGGYPTEASWQEGLVDIVHPQQDWQVKINQKEGGAFALISLYQPTLRFGISSTINVEDKEWETIWEIWEKAFSRGIGCRVSAGYGQPQKYTGKVLYCTKLKGQGAAPKLLDESSEFRPNIFKAALRGHALRIFGGLTDAQTADRLVEQLFGGIQGEGGTVGLLAVRFREKELEMDTFGSGSRAVATYEVEGTLSWLLTQSLGREKSVALQKLIQALTRFGMVFGGFGKSWRRADHRLFYPEYYQQNTSKSLIGCHWQWLGEQALKEDVKVRKLEHVAPFIEQVREIAKNWMRLQEFAPHQNHYAQTWREAWHPQKVQIWGRIADDAEDSKAIYWFHKPYRQQDARSGVKEGSIYGTLMTGKMSQVGRIWHRMYPLVRLVKDKKNPQEPLAKPTPIYLELLTIFPNSSRECEQFLEYLQSQATSFQLLWLGE